MTPRLVTPRTAFVLAGGAALGAMQVGMLRALYERGIVPDVLVGTSAGACHRGAVDAAVHARSVLVGGRLELDIARYAGEVELIVLRAVNSRRVQPADFSQSRRLIADAFAAARAALAAPAAPRRAATSLPAELAA